MQPSRLETIGIAVTAAFLVLSQQGAATANHGLRREAWEPLCLLSVELDEVPAAALDAATNVAKTALGPQKEAPRGQVYLAAKPDDSDNNKLAVLSAYQQTATYAIVKTLKAAGLEKALEATQTTSYLKGKIDEWLNIAKQTKGASHGCLAERSGGSAVAQAGRSIEGVTCPLTQTKLVKKARKATKLTEKGFSGLRNPGEDSSDYQDNTAECRLMHYDSGNGLVKTDHNDADSKMAYIDGYIQVSAAKSNKAVLAFGGSDAQPEASRHPAWAAAYAAVQNELKPTAEEHTNKTDKLTADAEAETLFALIGSAGKPRESTAVQAYKTQLFTASTADEVKRLMTKVATFKLPSKFGDKAKDTLLGEITEVNVLAALLADFQLKMHKI
uniref:Variant surface glycoprotein 1125.5091 n=1 Tax=Trypanosoma brucei TaxID=5691 RepID=A0A1J0RC29_9TRYP|nr:variant surface glycoprotein 1125.5091 [Trypanosoma brucei]